MNIPSHRGSLRLLLGMYGVDNDRIEIIDKIIKIQKFYDSKTKSETNFDITEWENLFK